MKVALFIHAGDGVHQERVGAQRVVGDQLSLVVAVEEEEGAVGDHQRREHDLFDLALNVVIEPVARDDAELEGGLPEALAGVHEVEHALERRVVDRAVAVEHGADALGLDVRGGAHHVALIEVHRAERLRVLHDELAAPARSARAAPARRTARRASSLPRRA